MAGFLISLFLCTQFIHVDFETLMGKQTSRWRFIADEQDKKAMAGYEALYEQNKNFQFLSEGEYKIPSEVHVIWLGPKPFPQESVQNMRMWIAEHPSWTVHFWTDRKRPSPVKGMLIHRVQDFQFEFLEDYYLESTNWGQKSDILRYEILNQLGGVYIDHDANCVRSFDGLHRGYDFYACLEVPHTRVDQRSVTAGIGIIGSAPRHPVIQGAIDEVMVNWEIVKQQFPQTSQKSLRDYVMHSTYLALTRSMENHLGQDQYCDMIFPASYFYPQKSLTPIYSYHYYGTSWADIQKEDQSERQIRKSYKHLVKQQRKALLLLGLCLGSTLLLFWRRK
ncbi:MAG: glycosyltransferase [Simkaniaceae bacterium]